MPPYWLRPFLRLIMRMGAHLRILSSLTSPSSCSCRGIHRWGRASNNTAVSLARTASSYATNGKSHSVHTGPRPQPAYPGHIPLTAFEKSFLAIGSALMSLIDTRRAGASQSLMLHMYVTDDSARHGCGLRGNHRWINFGEATGHHVGVSRGSANSQRTAPNQFKDLGHGEFAVSSQEHFWTCLCGVA